MRALLLSPLCVEDFDCCSLRMQLQCSGIVGLHEAFAAMLKYFVDERVAMQCVHYVCRERNVK